MNNITLSDSSRSKRILSLALNKQLQEKVTDIRTCQKNKKINQHETEYNKDPDFMPESSSESDDSTIGDMSTSINKCSSEKNVATQKINILSDITLNSSGTIVASTYPNQQSQSPKAHLNGNSYSQDNSLFNYIKCNIVADIINKAIDKAESKLYTKKGGIRKRKIFEEPLTERKRQKKENKRKLHEVKKACKCKLNCPRKIGYTRQTDINKQYWILPNEQQKQYILSCIEKTPKKRCTSKQKLSLRKYTYKYFLSSERNEKVNVCKLFFLGTFGYEKQNDRFLKNIRNTEINLVTPKKDQRQRPSSRKIERNAIIEHINSFHPTISHYRREHAPNRKYLPSDISITLMYKDFEMKFPNTAFSYELYRKVVSDLNISFANLGHEECWDCEAFKIHKSATGHDSEVVSTCDICKKWKIHIQKATYARKEYRKDAEKIKTPDELITTADLQKVIMLPRMETFKEIIFTQRIVAYNESFVPLGKKPSTFPCAILWHEGIAGRSKDDIISTYYAFFLEHRDIRHITIWLDNCFSQNKNWSLFSFFIYIVNSSDVALEDITIKYFEPGHTFMAADAFHHQVEQSLKKHREVYDFNDFCDVVKNANSSKVNIIKMQLPQFFDFNDYTSKYKLQKLTSKIYLKDMVCLYFRRGNFYFSYKTEFFGDFTDMKDVFLTKYMKGSLAKPRERAACRGVSLERKINLISKLKNHIPETRMTFWEELPASEKGLDGGNDSE